MLRSGTSIRKLGGAMWVGAALVLLVGGITLGSDPVAGAAAKTSVSSFTAKPSSLTWAGGTVTLSAKVADAKTCAFSVTPAIRGLPATKACTNGTVSEKVTVPKNTGTKAITYAFGLSVKGTTTVKATAVKVKVGVGPAPTVTDFTATPSPLAWTGGSVTLSAQVTDAKTCAFSSTPTIPGLPSTVSCSSGTVTKGVTVPANGETEDVVYTFRLSVTYASTVTATPTTVTVGASSPLTGVSSVATDGYGFCAVLSSGGVECWGYNFAGDLGIGTTGGPDGAGGYDTPQVVTGITNAVSVTGDGDASYCAVLSSGGMDCWGENADGELGNGNSDGPDGGGYDTPQAVTGVTNAVSAISDSSGFCAVLSSGGVDCWGDNVDGELGNGAVGGPDCSGSCNGTPQAVTGLTDADSVIGNGLGNCALLSTGGVDCWGDNEGDNLGNGTVDGPDNGSGYDTPQAVTGITNAVSVTSDNDGACAVLSTGEVDCWGENGSGQLGSGTSGGPDGGSGYDTPQAVTGITDVDSMASDAESYCALLSTGGMDCWGENAYGDLGIGTTGGPDGELGYDTPQAVAGIADTDSVISIGLGYCALFSSGGMDCWGQNYEGILGNGTINGPDGEYGYDTPQAVLGLTNADSETFDDSGYTENCAVLSTGGVDCWGDNTVGELGNGTVDAVDAGPDGIGGYDTPQAVSSE